MKALNQGATKTLQRLIENLEGVGDHKKIDNAKGSFMSVCVEIIGAASFRSSSVPGRLVSVAHYYEQNGDLMRDPEMIFWEWKDPASGRPYFFPVYFRQDGVLFTEQNSVLFEAGNMKGYYPKTQRDHAIFANTWMRNIKEQQGLR